MNWYILLLVFYVVLLGYHWWCVGNDVPRLTLWNRIEPPAPRSRATTCTDASDCPPDHLCHQGECIQKALRGGSCNPSTGDWVIAADARGEKTATCVCRYPHLVTQKLKGGNCNVDVACTPHGRIKDWTKLDACECDDGYEPLVGKLGCRRLTAVEYQQQIHKPPCDADENEYRNAVLYDYTSYLSHHKDKQCFKKLCEFDVLTGRSFKSLPGVPTYHPDIGCQCDPTLGRFAVRLESNFSTLKHYNGCASIFSEDPENEVDVEVHAYFYLLDGSNDRKPVVSFLVFNNIDPDEVNPVFREAVIDSGGRLVLEQDWPYDYMQYVFLSGQPFVVRSRQCYTTLFSNFCDEWVMKDNTMINCRDIGSGLRISNFRRQNAYWLLYAYPVCHIESNDTNVDEVYRGRFVSNPYHLLYNKEFPELLRSNGVVMKREKGRWVVDLSEPYKMDYYMRNHTKVPDVWNEKARKFETDTLTTTLAESDNRLLWTLV